MHPSLSAFGLLLLAFGVHHTWAAYDNELNCLVCHAVIDEAEKSIRAVSPKKLIDIGGRIKSDGNVHTNKKLYRRSQLHLQELLDGFCERFDDFVQGVWKKNEERAVIPIIVDGQMNPHFSEFEVRQDAELNKGVKDYCMSIVEEEEDALLQVLSEEGGDPHQQFCHNLTNICAHRQQQHAHVEESARVEL